MDVLNNGTGGRRGSKAAGRIAMNKSRVAAAEKFGHEPGGPGEGSDGEPDDPGAE